MKVKKITAILISTLMFFGLTACGNQSAQNSQSSQNSASAAQSVSGNTTPESSQEASGQEVSEQETMSGDIPAEVLTEDNGGNDDAGPADEGGKILVVYYSATGTMANVADYIAAATNADIFELEPADPYSSDDLNCMLFDAPLAIFLEEYPKVRKISFCLDNDGLGRKAAEALMEKYYGLDYEVEDYPPPKPFKDYNQWLQEAKKCLIAATPKREMAR